MARKKMIFGMGFRLFFLGSALIFFQAGLILLAVDKSQSLVTALDKATRKQMPAEDLLGSVKVCYEKVRQSLYEGLYAERTRDGERFKRADAEARSQIDAIPGRLDAVLDLQLGDKINEHVQELRAQAKEFGLQSLQLLAAADAVIKGGSKSEGKLDEARTKVDKAYEKLAATYEDVIGYSKLALQDNNDQGRDIVASLTRFSAVGLTISLLILAFVYAWTKYSFSRLTRRVSAVSAKILDLSTVLRAEATKTRDATITQSAAIQESASALSEMSSMIMQTGGNAKLSKDTALGAKEKAGEGGQIMERMTQAMGSISKANTQLQEIAKVIDDITSKTTVINDIVFKTQLLSFNASIEAARAGQHGRGFAVVAEEVGNLAELSGQAASDIEMLLNDSQRRVRETLEHIQNRVLDGNRVSGQALQTFNEIAKNIEEINGQVRAISDATQQQEIGVQQSTTAMKEMDNSSRETTASAENVQQTAENLAAQSAELALVLDALTRLTGTRSSVASQGAPQGQSSAPLSRWLPALSSDENAGETLESLISEIAAKRPAPMGIKAVNADDPDFKKVV